MIQTVNSYFTEKEDFPSKESNKPTNIFPPVFIKFFSYSIIYRMVSHTKNNTQHVLFAKKLITRSTNSRKNIYENVKKIRYGHSSVYLVISFFAFSSA